MIHSQAIALRCAASLPYKPAMSRDERRLNKRTGRQMYSKLLGLTRKALALLDEKDIYQQDCCANNAARRLLTGRSA